ncbi:MAG: enoyl-CoA hydratase/isomerase family protein [Chloroflexi bacterium]|jgi:enoyl-CoA hydratase|nr:enoyl-CoA hydratase/isomerase family protein [Chloroflexota bacterium]MBT4513636.1 enoyl-CoA hydratase/isomerase family protein [Chloroflexota bacterium]MBT6680973.1 enoyl-CoA hydratase/isomerase family protein [Chloroflexota bacterium]
MPEQAILVEHDGPVATVILNRPDKMNAISLEMWADLTERVDELEKDTNVRVIVFRGQGGRAFSAGADIGDFEASRHDSASAMAYAEVFEGALEKVAGLTVPTISMIEGVCVGGGLELASCTDVRIAAEGSRFGVPVARIGVVAGFREMRRLVAIAGPANAAYVVLSGEVIGHAAALEMGLLTRVVSASELSDDVYGLAKRMATLSPVSHAAHKEILETLLSNPSLADVDTKAPGGAQFRSFDSEDFKIGTDAFVNKTRPEFTGR